jgi:hypothetical protein
VRAANQEKKIRRLKFEREAKEATRELQVKGEGCLSES